MNTTKEQHGFYTIVANNTVENIALQKKRVSFRKIYIYPFKGHTAGTPTDNTADCYIGWSTDSPRVCPDVLSPGDRPLSLTIEPGEPKMLLEDIIIKGTAGDGVFYSYYE